MGLFDQVFNVARQIPEGKVTTYGHIAKHLGLKDTRKIGWALHSNKDPDTPCHRVVNKDGRLAPNFAFDGPEEQRRRLELEGVEFIDNMHVNLDRHLFDFNPNP